MQRKEAFHYTIIYIFITFHCIITPNLCNNFAKQARNYGPISIPSFSIFYEAINNRDLFIKVSQNSSLNLFFTYYVTSLQVNNTISQMKQLRESICSSSPGQTYFSKSLKKLSTPLITKPFPSATSFNHKTMH